MRVVSNGPLGPDKTPRPFGHTRPHTSTLLSEASLVVAKCFDEPTGEQLQILGAPPITWRWAPAMAPSPVNDTRNGMKKTVWSAAAVAMLLAGCGSKTDPNAKNFGAALDQYFAKRGDLCLGTPRWPVEIEEQDVRIEQRMPGSRAGQMAALEAIGLAKSTEVDKPSVSFTGLPTGRTYRVKSYTLTDASKPYQREVAAASVDLLGKPVPARTDLCWGRKALAEVVKWEGPMKLGDYQEALVQYRYKVDAVADWATKPEVAAVYPQIARVIKGANGEPSQHAVKLTSEGWEARGLDNLS